MKRIVVVLEGGLVQNVLTEEPAEVVVVDYDVEGADEEEISAPFGNDAILRQFGAEVNPDHVATAFAGETEEAEAEEE